jgi:cytochrome c oxidase assembly protein subunit 15
LLVAELAQGVIGYVQYFTDLPIALVAAHLVGAAILVAAGTRLVVEVVASDARPSPRGADRTDTPSQSVQTAPVADKGGRRG